MQDNNIYKGSTQIKVEDLLKLFNKGRKQKLSLKRGVEVLKDNYNVIFEKAIPFLKASRKLKQNETTKSFTNKMKFEYFIEKCEISKGETLVHIDEFFNYYDTWAKETNKQNVINRHEFSQAARQYFEKLGRNYCLNKELKDFIQKGDVVRWRKGVKKEKA